MTRSKHSLSPWRHCIHKILTQIANLISHETLVSTDAVNLERSRIEMPSDARMSHSRHTEHRRRRSRRSTVVIIRNCHCCSSCSRWLPKHLQGSGILEEMHVPELDGIECDNRVMRKTQRY